MAYLLWPQRSRLNNISEIKTKFHLLLNVVFYEMLCLRKVVFSVMLSYFDLQGPTYILTVNGEHNRNPHRSQWQCYSDYFSYLFMCFRQMEEKKKNMSMPASRTSTCITASCRGKSGWEPQPSPSRCRVSITTSWSWSRFIPEYCRVVWPRNECRFALKDKSQMFLVVFLSSRRRGHTSIKIHLSDDSAIRRSGKWQEKTRYSVIRHEEAGESVVALAHTHTLP